MKRRNQYISQLGIPRKVYGGNFMIGFVILFGVLNIVAQVGANLGWFASFAG